MTSILASRPPTRLPATGDLSNVVPKAADCRILCFGFANLENYVRSRSSGCSTRRRARDSCVVFSGKLEDSDSVGGDDDSEREDSGNDPVSCVFPFFYFFFLLSVLHPPLLIPALVEAEMSE